MSSSLGDRVSMAATGLAVLAFRISIAIFDWELAKRLSLLRRRVRDSLKRRGGEIDTLVEGQPKAETVTRKGAAVKPPSRLSQPASIPIVLIHKNNSDHLAYSLAQAKKSNPASTVFLLGDDSNDQYEEVEHLHYRDYFAGASRFEETYRHYSTHPEGFELICFQRWFILKEFLNAHQLTKCVYLDSDVLLYANVTDDMGKFRRFDFTLCWNAIGCVFFLNQFAGLENLCQFMMAIYSKNDQYHYDRLVAHFAARQKNQLPGGACDMTVLHFYNELNFGRVGEASHIIDGSVYDPNINMPHPGFEMQNGIKKVIWKNELPYGTYTATGETVRFNSLHFNGRAKSLMPQYCTASLMQGEASFSNTPVSR